MFNLIKKDFFLQKKLLLIYFIILCFYLWSDFPVAMVIVNISALFVINSHYYDEKDKANRLLNALPYTRKEIVSSKYIGAMLFTTVVIPVCMVGQYIVDSTQLQFSVKDIILSFLLVMMFTAFYLPFFYKFTQQYLLTVFTVLFVLLMIFAQRIVDFFNSHLSGGVKFFMEASESQLYLIFTCIAVIFYGISWVLSIRIYQKKAF